MIVALYAGEDEAEVFRALDVLYQRHPREVEYYIPQLCTYLFHFSWARSSDQEGLILPSGQRKKDCLVCVDGGG